jgi:hypothetical protein
VISFGLVVAANNLLACKNFTVFLNNYKIFEKPSFLERWLLPKAQNWISKKAIRNFQDVLDETKKFEINIGLKDCSTGMFTVLYIANEYRLGRMVIHDALELFQLISHTELEFEKLKNPKSDESYK